jgi:hypothetical protein
VAEQFFNVEEDLSRSRYELELFLLGGPFRLYEDARQAADVSAACSSADVSYGKLILSCWGENWSRSWRVISVEVKPDRVRLRCTRQMGRAKAVLELCRAEKETDLSTTRDEFASRLASMIESNLQGLRVESAVASRDDRNHFSGVHTRLILKDRNRIIAAVGAGGREPQSHIDSLLGAGIVWLEGLRRKGSLISRLMLFAPRGRSSTLSTRLTALQLPDTLVSLYEVEESSGEVEAVAAFDQGDLSDRLRRARALWPGRVRLKPEAAAVVEQICNLAPDSIAINRSGGFISLSIHGLEFARVSVGSSRAEFGLEVPRRRLNAQNWCEMEKLVAQIDSQRAVDAADRAAFAYRAQSERWLESVVRRDVAALDPALDPDYVYSQVPAYRGEQRSFIDLLAITRTGRLVVIELKVAEDAEFPFQGLDYWLRVEWHRLRRDFRSRDYFKGRPIADLPPLLYLVAPVFRFHASTGLIAGAISERVPVYRIGINENWRAGVRVLMREKLN